jgi:lysozyme
VKISNRGLIEIMSHEGICLSPYLDSVGVWTIGVGITAHDGVNPKDMGDITLEQAIALFKARIVPYANAVDKLPHEFNQTQYEALVSFCYNVGPGNLAKLCKNRSINAIGTALMLYTKPPEITARRQKEQRLYQYGQYSNKDGRVLVFPVVNNKPVYKKGYYLDATKFFDLNPPSTAPDVPAPTVPVIDLTKPAEPTSTHTVTDPKASVAPKLPLDFNEDGKVDLHDLWEWLRKH